MSTMDDLAGMSSTQRRAKRREATVAELIAAGEKRRRITGAEVADAVGLLLLGLIALSGMRIPYGDQRYLAVGAIGLVLSGGLAWAFARRGWPLWALAGALLGVYVVGGSMLTAADAFLVPPDPSAFAGVLTGAVQGWANLLATTVPVGSAQQLLVVPWVSAVVVGGVSMSIARRAPRAYLAALIGPFALLVAGLVVGVDRPAWTWQATAFAVVALLWGSYRQRVARSAAVTGSAGIRRFRLGATAGVLVVAGLLGFAVGSASFVSGDDAQRTVVRDRVEPPIDLDEVPSPLEQFRTYRAPVDPSSAEPVEAPVVFRVGGLAEGQLLRLATLDRYDGEIWHVEGGETGDDASSLFKRVGQQIPTSGDGTPQDVELEIVDYDGVWIPTPGEVRTVEFGGERADDLTDDFRYNIGTQTGVVPSGLRAGDEIELQADVVDRDEYADVETGQPSRLVSSGSVDGVDALDKLWTTYFEDAPADPLARLRHLEARFQGGDDFPPEDRGYFSSGRVDEDEQPSLPGHGAGRLAALLEPGAVLLGDEEQYAAALALAADRLGFPTRVVVGFAPPAGSTDGSVDVRSSDITAWTEVAVDGVGWIPLFPTPTETKIEEQVTQPKPPPNRRYPAPPEEPPILAQQGSGSGEGGEPCTDCTTGSGGGGAPLPLAVQIAGAVLLPPLAVVGGFTALMALLKLRRRKRRRSSGTPGERIAAGWDDVCDLAADLGDVVPPTATRRETAVVLARPGVAALARSADTQTFGPVPPDPTSAEAYWRGVDLARGAILGPTSRFQRWKALVNPTSLRSSRRRRRAVATGGAR